MNNLKSVLILFLVIFGTYGKPILAHCDSMEGPVVKAAQKALETGNINYVLINYRNIIVADIS